MDGLGPRARAIQQSPGEVLLADLNGFVPLFIEEKIHGSDQATLAILRLVRKCLNYGSDVVLLSRNTKIGYKARDAAGKPKWQFEVLGSYLHFIRSNFPEGQRHRISISNVHKYKGLEKSAVILIDVLAHLYPQIHSNWIFSRILGTNLNELEREERRLLYVGLTRAEEKVIILSDSTRPSPYIDDIQRKVSLGSIRWEDYPLAPGQELWRIVKIGNMDGRGSSPTKELKDRLPDDYSWNPRRWPGWSKAVPDIDFSIERLKQESWVAYADGVEVRVLDATEKTVLAKYCVLNGNWQCVQSSV